MAPKPETRQPDEQESTKPSELQNRQFKISPPKKSLSLCFVPHSYFHEGLSVNFKSSSTDPKPAARDTLNLLLSYFRQGVRVWVRGWTFVKFSKYDIRDITFYEAHTHYVFLFLITAALFLSRHNARFSG